MSADAKCETCERLRGTLKAAIEAGDKTMAIDCRVLLRRHPAHDARPIKANQPVEEPAAGTRKVCGAVDALPVRLAVVIVETAPDGAGRPDLEAFLRCPLEEHASGPHYALVWQLDDAARGEMWVRWADGQVPECSLTLPDCPGHNGRTGAAEEGCTLFADHPGAHSFDLRDPGDEALRSSPEYARLQALFDERLRDASFPYHS
ncbi:hypothetical protein ACWF94_14605 [Streptomyces sp. NPDC055078]